MTDLHGKILIELAEQIERVNSVAKRSGSDGRVFIDYRDWEALRAAAIAALVIVKREEA